MVLVSVLTVTGNADWYDDVSGGKYVTIEGDAFVADTFCGVDALYSENNDYYQCNELVIRFYMDAYDLNIMAYPNIGLRMLTEGYRFVQQTEPKKGDIVYSPSSCRKNKGDHWAIVKDYHNGRIELFEQNVVWVDDGVKKAGINRKLKFPSDYYYLYTPVALEDYPDPVLKGDRRSDATTTQTTVKATEKPAEQTTSVPVTSETVPLTSETIPETTAVTTAAVTEQIQSVTVADYTENNEMQTEAVIENPEEIIPEEIPESEEESAVLYSEYADDGYVPEETAQAYAYEGETEEEKALGLSRESGMTDEFFKDKKLKKILVVLLAAVSAAIVGVLLFAILKRK